MHKLAMTISGMLICAVAASAQEKPVLAVFDLEDRGSGLNDQSRENLTQLLMVKLAECGYQVVPREQIRERLREQQRSSYKACYDESCQIELGRELAAQKSLSSQVMKIGAGCQLGATLYDLKKSAAEGAASASGGCGEDGLLGLVNQVSEKLCQPLREALAKVSAQVFTSYDRILGEAASLREESVRRQKVWQEVRALAGDDGLPRAARAEVLKKYLAEAGADNPLRSEAEKLLESLTWGHLTVKTSPSGAKVRIGNRPAGAAPFTVELPPGTHRVWAWHRNYQEKELEAEIPPGASIELMLDLERIWPMNPYKKWGHIAFWSGLGLTAAGVLSYLAAVDYASQNVNGDPSAADKGRLWRDAGFGLWAGGGALLTTGVVLWLLSPGDRAWFEKHPLTVLPLGGGAALCAGGKW